MRHAAYSNGFNSDLLNGDTAIVGVPDETTGSPAPGNLPSGLSFSDSSDHSAQAALSAEGSTLSGSSDHTLAGDSQDLFVNGSSPSDAGSAFDASFSNSNGSAFQLSSVDGDNGSVGASFSLDSSMPSPLDSDVGAAQLSTVSSDATSGTAAGANSGFGVFIDAAGDVTYIPEHLTSRADPIAETSVASAGPAANASVPLLAHEGDLGNGLGEVQLGPTSASSSGGSGSTSGSSGSGTVSQITTAGSGLVIDINWDTSVANAPSGFVTAVDSVASYYESHFSNPITITIDVGYGEIDGAPLGSGAVGESESYLTSVSYSSLEAALVKNANAIGDTAAAASLTATDPTNGGSFWLSTAEAKALGLTSATSSMDGYVGFSNTVSYAYNDSSGVPAGQYDFSAVVAHEFSEIMGRTMFDGEAFGSGLQAYTPLDLFHYSKAGVRDFSGTTAGYFSANGGVTNLGNFNTNPNGDFGDWAGSVGHNAYLAAAGTGVVLPVTANDLTEMNILGWDPATSSAPVVTVTLSHDTGSSATDGITSNPALIGTADANAVVTLTEGSTVLGTATANASGAWSFSPTGLAQGAQTITASETNSAGVTGSGAVSFTLDTVAPTVTAQLVHDTGSSATDGITSNPALIGTADANAVVTLTEGSTVLGTATANANGAWSFTPTGLAQGAQTITATETNLAGNTGSAAVSFTLDAVAPTVTAQLAHDTGLSATDGITSNPALSGTADANAVVTLTEGSTVLGTATADASGAWSFSPTGPAQGAQTITATETDLAGNTGSAAVSFTLDTVAPTVTAQLAHDTGSSATDGITSNPALSGTADANAVVTLTEGSTVLGTATADAGGAWSFSPTGLAQGAQTITASETDLAGNTGSAAVSFTLDTVAPTVTAQLAHDTGSSATDGITSNPALSGTADANAVVTLTEGSTVLGTATADAGGAWSFSPTGLAQGAQTITASETDLAGNTGSAAVSFTLDAVAPTVTAQLADSTGANNVTANPALSGTADANAVVTLTEGSTVLGTATADASGAWSFSPTGLAQGAQTITASETDLAGNTGSAAVSFTLDTVAPTVTAQLADSTGANNVTANPALSGTADANAVVTLTEGSTVLGTAIANASGAWSFSPTGLAQGAQTITASETDLAGNTGSAAVSFTLESAEPTVTAQLAHDTGSSATDGITSNPALIGTADANAVVTLTEGSTVLGTATADASGAWSFSPTGLAQGAQTITASETNAAGMTGGASVSFTLESAEPTVTAQLSHDTGSSATDGITSNPALIGTADANAVVTLTEGSTVLGTATANASGAWSFSPTGLAQGAQTITASETNSAGVTGSGAVSFTLDTVAPTVTAQLVHDTGSSATDGITSNPALIGTADANAVVTLTEGSTVLGTATANANGAWSFSPTGLAQGAQTITATETNLAGNTGSAAVSFTLDAVAPTVTAQLAHDTGLSATDGITSNPALSGTADANAVVTLTEGSTVLGTATADASGAWSFSPTGPAQGAQTITATETDLAGNTGSAAVSFTLDAVAPTVTAQLAHDTGSSATDGITSNPALSGTADANAVVTLTEGSTVLGTATADAGGAWSFSPTGLAQGAQTITASETDLAGNTGSAAVSFTLDTVAPTVTAQLADSTGANNVTANPALSGTADANAVVTLTEGSTVLGTATADASGAWSFSPTGLAQGAQTITASETDLAGNTGSAAVSFTLDTVAPTVTAQLADSTGANNVTANPALSGTADANAVVTLTEGSTVLGTAIANASGAWSFSPTGLAQGAQTITASETDLAGNTGSAAVSFTLDTVAPTVASETVSGPEINGGAGTLTAGETAILTVAMSEAVTVAGGDPILTLNDGGTAIYDAAHSSSTTLVFDYTVSTGENTSALDVTGVNLNVATVTDLAGNAADFSGAGNDFYSLAINGSGTHTTSQTFANGMTETWTYSSTGTLQEIDCQGITCHNYTSTDTVYGANGKASEAWANGSTIIQTEAWNADGTINNIHHYDITGQPYTDYDIVYGANNQPVSATYSNGMTKTWTYSEGTLQELDQTGITGQNYTSTEKIYDANGKVVSEVWANDASTIRTEAWNADGSVHDIHYYGITNQAYTDYDVAYGANDKPLSATYSNGMTTTWTYSEGTLQELDQTGITGQNYTSTEKTYDANGKAVSEVWANDALTMRTEVWNADGSVHDIHYYGITNQAYTDYDVAYGANDKPLSATYSDGMTETWSYNADGSYDVAMNNIVGQNNTSWEKIFDPNFSSNNHLAVQDTVSTNGGQHVIINESSVTLTASAGGMTFSLPGGNDSFSFDFDSHTSLSINGSNENLVFNEGFGNATISNINNDTVQFGSGLFSGFADLLSHSSQDKAGDTIIADNHGDVLTLTHTAMTALQASHFLLG